MATGNFYCKNTTEIFVIGMNEYTTQEDIDELGLDQDMLGQFDEIRTQDNFEADKELAQELLQGKDWDIMDRYQQGCNRSYPASIIGEKTIHRTFAGVTLELTMQATLVSAYYEGANFDLEASLNVYDRDDYHVCNYDDFDDIFNISDGDVISDNWQGNIGLTKIHCKGILRTLDELLDGLRNEAEDCFRQASQHRLYCLGHANNGEAFYREIEAA